MMAADGRSDLFGQAKVYNSVGSLVTTIPVNPVADGLYSGSWTPTLEGYYSVRYEFFFDNAYLIPAGYEVHGETIDVTSFKANILRLLGLVHENSVVDLVAYDVDGNMIQSRIRTYDSAANSMAALAASPAGYPTGLRFQYQVSATYSGGVLTKYHIERQV